MYLGLNLKYSETWAVIMSLYRVAEMETRGGRSHRVVYTQNSHNYSPPKLLLKLLEGYCLVRRILLMDFILSPLLR